MSTSRGKSHGPDGSTASTTVRLWAGARAAAGRDEVEVTDVQTVEHVVAALGRRIPDLAPILAVSTLLVDGRRVEPQDSLRLGDVLEVLPPFAGG